MLIYGFTKCKNYNEVAIKAKQNVDTLLENHADDKIKLLKCVIEERTFSTLVGIYCNESTEVSHILQSACGHVAYNLLPRMYDIIV